MSTGFRDRLIEAVEAELDTTGVLAADIVDAILPLIKRTFGRTSCPTCTGPTRETVGMVCQACGTDYGRVL